MEKIAKKFYYVWRNMRQRCYNPKSPNYDDYGGRGIKVCPEWMTYENFEYDMYESYAEKMENIYYYSDFKRNTQVTLDRVDNEGDYSKKNCKWSTVKEQNNNRRPSLRTRAIEIDGEFNSIAGWSRYFKINQTTVYWRIHVKKWSIEKSLKTPTKPYKKRVS